MTAPEPVELTDEERVAGVLEAHTYVVDGRMGACGFRCACGTRQLGSSPEDAADAARAHVAQVILTAERADREALREAVEALADQFESLAHEHLEATGPALSDGDHWLAGLQAGAGGGKTWAATALRAALAAAAVTPPQDEPAALCMGVPMCWLPRGHDGDHKPGTWATPFQDAATEGGR